MSSDFDSCLTKGKKAEKLFFDMMKCNSELLTNDVTNDPYFQGIGVDFLVTNKRTSQSKRVEVKYSTHGPILELYDNEAMRHKGWSFTSDTDLIYYFDDEWMTGFDWRHFKKWCYKNIQEENKEYDLYFDSIHPRSTWFKKPSTSYCEIVKIKNMLKDKVDMPWLIERTSIKDIISKIKAYEELEILEI